MFELAVRRYLVLQPESPASRHRRAVERVKAAAQAEHLRRLEGFLGPEEKDVVRRARNFKAGAAPRGVSAADYHASTAFEALLGYLYLSGRRQRLEEILRLVVGDPEGAP